MSLNAAKPSSPLDSTPSSGSPRDLLRRLLPESDERPIDLDYLGRFTLGNATLEAEVLGLFVTYAPGYLQQLVDADTAKAWRDAGHTLKGAARGIGAKTLGNCAEIAEKVDFQGDADYKAFVLDCAAEALAEVIAFIRTLPSCQGKLD